MMYFLEWGIWKGRAEIDYSADVHVPEPGKYSGLLADVVGPDTISPKAPDDAYALYNFNDRYIDVRGAMQEEKRGLITFIFLVFVSMIFFLVYLGLFRPIYDASTGRAVGSVSSTVLFSACVVAMLAGVLYSIWKFLRYMFRLEIFTQRQVIVRFNRASRQVYINRPAYAGGIMTFAWDATISGVDFEQADEVIVDHPLMLQWPAEKSGAGFDEIAFLGEPMDGNNKVVGLWEYIRRYMQDGPAAVPPPKRLRPLWPSPLLSIREVWSFLMPMWRRGGGVFSLVWGVVLFPLMVLHVICHWLSMVLCHPVRWPKEIEEAGLPGKPIPKVTVAEDYGPEIAEKLRASAARTRSGGWDKQ